jgi:hypothetical protein
MKIHTIKALFHVAILTGLFGMLTAGFAQQAEMIGGGVGITVFRDRDFRGTAATYRNDIPNLAGTEFNDQISSIRVGAGEQWEVCERANYGGRCVVVSGEESDLRRNSWDNMISSIRRVGGGYPGPGPDNPYIVLYTDANYRGNPTRYTERTNNLFAMNQRAESVTVGRGEWQLCDGIGFAGRCVTVSQSVPNLASLGMRDKVRSVRPVGYDQPNPNPGSAYIVIFDQANFRGTPTNYDSVRTNISKRARSITIGAGTWQICDGNNFTGRCETLSQSVSNLAPHNIGNTIRSVRPLGIVPPTPNPYIVIFDQTNFRGDPTNYNSARSNIDKRARSITIGAGTWQICDGRNYTGRCQTISQSVSDLRNYNIGDMIRSVRPIGPQPR